MNDNKKSEETTKLEAQATSGCLKMGCVSVLLMPFSILFQAYAVWTLINWFLVKANPELANLGIMPIVGMILLLKVITMPLASAFSKKDAINTLVEKSDKQDDEEVHLKFMKTMNHAEGEIMKSTALSFMIPAMILSVGWVIMWLMSLVS